MTKMIGSPVSVIGMELCKQAGIDPHQVTGIDLHLDINKPATLTVRMIPDGTISLAEVVQQFQIIPVEEENIDG